MLAGGGKYSTPPPKTEPLPPEIYELKEER